MEWLIVIGVVYALYYLSENKQKNKEVTKERIVQRIETNQGYIERETTRTFEAEITEHQRKNIYVAPPTPPSINEAQRIEHSSASTRVERVINPDPHTELRNKPVDPHSNTTHKRIAMKMAESEQKACPQCKKVKNTTEFRLNPNTDDGLTKWCSACLDSSNKPQSHLKKCPNCKQMRKLTSYYHSDKNPDGLTKWCKFCLDKK